MDINKRAPFTLFVFWVVFTVGNGFDTTGKKLTENEAMIYLEKYNYLNETVVKASSTYWYGACWHSGRGNQFQEMVNIPVTGKLDDETLRKMALPLCGVKDVPENGPANLLAARIWPKKTLSWKITQYSTRSRLMQNEQKDAMDRAFNLWARKTPLIFVYQADPLGPADMDIKFAIWYHGDGDRFDGPGGTLAHAFFPTVGKIHFDDHETWLLGANAKNAGTELYIVAAHEIGHALGLDHSNRPGSLMAPTYSYSSYLMLNSDDVYAIQRLYGNPSFKRKSTWWFLRK